MQRLAKLKGFTLLELVMVVAILALLSTIGITVFGSLQRVQAEKVSISNQQATARAIMTFLTVNNGTGLDRLDALIDFGTPAATSSATQGTFAGNAALNSATAPGGVYRGVKAKNAAGDAPDAATASKNKGLDAGLSGKVSVYYLTSGNLTALKSLGITTVYYHNYSSDRANTLLATNPDGTAVTAAPGFRVESTAAYPTPLVAGTAVLAVDPRMGAAIYKSFGQDLKLATSATDADAKTAASTSGWYLLLFGLGDQASIIGNRQGGLDSAPRSEICGTDYYRQYFVVVRVPTTPNAFNAEFVGLLDPKGQTVKDARFANDWRNGGN
jgi:prepilin-type N-terminal cleavage/methylation domain-containing protein